MFCLFICHTSQFSPVILDTILKASGIEFKIVLHTYNKNAAKSKNKHENMVHTEVPNKIK